MLGTFPNWLQILDRTLQAQGRQGCDLSAALHAADVALPQGATGEVVERLPVAVTRKVWAAADALAGDPVLGLTMLKHVDFTDFGELGVVLAAGGSLPEVTDRIQRFHRLLTDALTYRVSQDAGTLSIVIHASAGTHWRAEEFAAALVAALLRYRLRPAVRPSRVQLAFDNPAGLAIYERYYGCPVVMRAAETELSFPMVETGGLGASARLAQAFEPILEDQLAQLGDAAPWSRKVAALCAAYFAQLRHEADFTLDDAAQSLHTSARTLQRHLGHEGRSFRDVMDDTRRELVEKWLARRGELAHMRSLTELALQLGFSSSSAFNRAFRRWFGEAPGDAVKRQETS